MTVWNQSLKKIYAIVMLAGLFASCMPQQTARTTLDANGQTNTPDSTETLADFDGETRNFFHTNGTRVFDVLTWETASENSFMIWGEQVQKSIKALPTTSKVCLMLEYKHVTPSRILVMSAVRRRQIVSQTSTSVKVTYHWIVYPQDGARNQQDCLTSGMLTAKNTLFGSPNPMTFSLTDACQNCSSQPLSQSMFAYTDAGNLVPTLDLSALKIRIKPSVSSGGGNISCSTSSSCVALNYDCCMEGQCVRDRAVRNGVDQTTPLFMQVLNEIAANAQAYKQYPEYFYVCPNNIPDTGDDDEDEEDSEFEARKTLNETRDLYECLNPQFDEISYCAVRIPQATALVANAGTRIFPVRRDDNNFRWTGNNLASNTVQAIRYGEITLYQEGLSGYDTTPVTNSHALQGTPNGDLGVAVQSAEVSKVLPTGHPDDTLVIKYKVDGTCEKLSTDLARCRKSYVQGRVSIPPRPSDHGSGSLFNLPAYAKVDDPYFPSVKLNGDLVAMGPTTWEMSGQAVRFHMSVTTNQKVDITYYVTTGVDELVAGKTLAQTRVDEMCGKDVGSNLAPRTVLVNGVPSIVAYDCTYKDPNPPVEVPLFQEVYVSAKAVPSRYYDINGSVWDGDSGSAAPLQEGIEFNYTGNDKLKPNNGSSYVGFHEIYGSFNKAAGAPKPPRVVQLKKDRVYDLYTISGSANPCSNCGSDPYQATLKLFPQSFNGKGGGYTPDVLNTSRRTSTGMYRADDLLFGRACHVPATMIPGTHVLGTSVKQQRQRRLAAQHFLHANGYSRDWYGFDYGSVIGSFDGVTWFSIGNQRRIKAAGSRLFLAVNANFGDLTIDDSFLVTINEQLGSGGTTITHDTMSDGAQCQKSHYCSTDDDCIRQVGYDYSCQNVNSINTTWPQFDTSGNEIIGSNSKTLVSILGGTNGQNRRCVYRGRGAACDPNLASHLNISEGIDHRGLNACAPNTYCAAVDGAARFNTSIARFAAPPASQNALINPIVQRDVFGLGARIIGRPMDFYGNKSPGSVTQAAWGFGSGTTLADYLKNSLGIKALCVPGRDITGDVTYADTQVSIPAAAEKESADRIFGVGSTMKLSSTVKRQANLLAMCPSTDSGNYLHLDHTRTLTSSAPVAIAQNIPSSLMDMPAFTSLALFNTTAGSAAAAIGHQRNSCLRAPGASCFSDMECAPSDFVAGKMKSLGSWGTLSANLAEQAFWKEELVCGNPQPAYDFGGFLNSAYDIKQNKCCRQFGKTMQIYTQLDGSSSFLNCAGTKPAIAGVNIDYDSPARNTRNHVVYDKVTCVNPAAPVVQDFPALIAPTPRGAADALMNIETILGQYKTLDLMNSRMCCTGNWVRNFASENGGGHAWGEGRAQTIDKQIFFAWNWYGDKKFTTTLDEDDTQPLHCSNENFATLACEIRNLTDIQVRNYLKWIERFELVGIPQVMIPDPLTAGVGKLVDENQVDIESTAQPLDDTLASPITYGVNDRPNIADVVDAKGTAGGADDDYYVSAANYTKMKVSSGKVKKVFSESEFSCCVPAGGTIPSGASANTCCTGTLTDAGGGPARCCLGDFADVTVYLNRYVSSEGRGLPDSAYDQQTGYIKDPAQVYAIANARKLCCSGKIVSGNAVFNLSIPLLNGTYNATGKSRRFVYRSDAVDNNNAGAIGDYYDSGIRWNNHFYCAPAGYTAP